MSENFYVSEDYINKHPSYHVEDSPWKATQILKMLNKHNINPNTVAEIGCGAGEILLQLQQQLPAHIEFYGYDISPSAIALCRERENKQLHCLCDDLIKLDNVHFDLILCIDVLEHVEDYLGFLRRLQSQATFKLFHIPLDMAAHMIIREKPIKMVREECGHLHYFMKSTALASLTDTGHEVIDWFYTPNWVERAYHFRGKLLKWPRKMFARLHQDLAVRTLGGYSLMVLTR